MARPRVALLSAEKISQAALDQVDAVGDFSIPDIARELGVSPSSIYHHLEGRAGILNGIRSLIGRDVVREVTGHGDGMPRGKAVPWQDDVRSWATKYAGAMSRHPQAVALIVSEQAADAPTLEIYEALAGSLRRAGLAHDQVLIAISMLEILVFGAAIDAASPVSPWKVDPDKHANLSAAIDSLPPAERQARAFKQSLEAIIQQLEYERVRGANRPTTA